MQALVVVQALVAVQAPYTILHPPCKLRPPSLFSYSPILSLSLWPTKAECSTTCHQSTTHHPPPLSLPPLDWTTNLVTQSPKLKPLLPISFSQAISLHLSHNWCSVWGRGRFFLFWSPLHSQTHSIWPSSSSIHPNLSLSRSISLSLNLSLFLLPFLYCE